MPDLTSCIVALAPLFPMIPWIVLLAVLLPPMIRTRVAVGSPPCPVRVKFPFVSTSAPLPLCRNEASLSVVPLDAPSLICILLLAPLPTYSNVDGALSKYPNRTTPPVPMLLAFP